ncbi:ABC transporter permease [candidate division KSB1 bacterium]
MKKNNIPRFGSFILNRILNENIKYSYLGDIEETYFDIYESEGKRQAVIWYWGQVMKVLMNYIINIRSGTMFKNYFKIAFRTFWRNRLYSVLNISGLSIGIGTAILIILWVQDELSYDMFHTKADRIYRIAINARIGNNMIAQTVTPGLLGRTLTSDYPEVEIAAPILSKSTSLVQYNEKVFNESKIIASDSTFFRVFTIPFIKGDSFKALTAPNSVVITRRTAEKYFEEENALDRMLEIGGEIYRITGVVEDVPVNSHFHFDFIISLNRSEYNSGANWDNNRFRTYIILQKDFPPEELEAKFPDFIRKYLSQNKFSGDNFWEYYLQPLTDIHLNSHLNGEFEANGNRTHVYIFSIIAAIILLIACINFMNMTTAKSANRAKEVGIRKVSGSNRIQLIRQFVGESILLSTVSFVLALIVVEIILPVYTNYVGKQLQINYGNPLVILSMTGMILFVGILSGSYPAFFLSSFKPVTVIKGALHRGVKNSRLRNSLVVFQFTISIFLIIGTIVVYKQLEFIRNTRLGFDKEQVVVVNNPMLLGEQAEVFKENLLNNPEIISASLSNTLPGRGHGSWGITPEGMDIITLDMCVTDEDFIKTMNIELVQGKYFSKDFPSNASGLIINENAVKMLDWDDPVGKSMKLFGQIKISVIGVIKDYHYKSVHQEIKPMGLLHLSSDYATPGFLSIKIKTENVGETVAFIERTWNEFAPNRPYDYSFLDSDYDGMYNFEERTGHIFTFFSILAILIASMGLFGLASYMAEQRKKEMGVRKVMGASVVKIVRQLSKAFLIPVLISNLIAWPLGWFMMNRWLENFAYRTSIDISIFIFAGSLALLIALLTISFQTIKAARSNPVDSLRYE